MISFMNFFSCLRMPVDMNTWRAAIGFFGNVSMGPWIFYLTKCFRCILYSILLLIIYFLFFAMHFYDKYLGVMAFLSLHVDSVNNKRISFGRFSNKCCTIPRLRMFFCSLFFFILVILLVLSGE